MGSSTAFGYEQDNGSVRYLLTHEFSLDEIHPLLLRRETPNSYILPNTSISSNEYFDNFEEDTTWRILYCLDGTIICKKSTIPGMFKFTYN